jgi:hypothetical protein
MRFLMNTLVALSSTAIDSCVPTKLSLDALELFCCRVLSEAWLTIIGVTGPGTMPALESSGTRSIPLLKANPAAIDPKSSYCCRLHPSSKVLFPYL